MASAFGHIYAAFALGKGFSKKLFSAKFWVLGFLCSVIPDFDVISFSFGIPYKSFWGHRGFTHSFVFAFLLAVSFTFLFFRKHTNNKEKAFLTLYFFLATASHGLLDALTNGGRGVALLAPFDNTRYFFPWTPIKVSPIGIERFFSDRGLQVILSELIWIGIPCTLYIIVLLFLKKKTKT